ncbi:MAG TPA: hypothetical protein VKN62_00545 [Pelovirga sp.]|nr:hypothetical protein [Pelovirga sp.]
MKTEKFFNYTNMIQAAKWAFSTRRVRQYDAVGLRDDVENATPGDLVLGRIQKISSHRRIQLRSGRPNELYPDDLIVAACGARYASDQFEGIAKIDPLGTDLLAGGGCLGKMRVRNDKMKLPTRVLPIGLLTTAAGAVLNLNQYSLPPAVRPQTLTAIGVVGSSMNSGKTDATASLVHGLSQAGYRVAALKATGTGAFGDYNAYVDAGADYTADFTDAGLVSTYEQPLPRIEQVIDTLLGAAANNGCNIAVVEFADGVLQQETAALLKNPKVRSAFIGFLYAAPDSLAAFGGTSTLKQIGITPLALTGLITQSPLNVREAEIATGLPVISREDLRDPAQASNLINSNTTIEKLRLVV